MLIPHLPQFKPERATELASWLLEWAGGSMEGMKLVKLIYIIDRYAWARDGWPVTFDRYVSMKYGPVPSGVYNLLKRDEVVSPKEQAIWDEYIDERRALWVRLRKPPLLHFLSESQLDLAREVFNQLGRAGSFDLSELTHKAFPEWTDPGESSLPISYNKLLEALGKTQEEIETIFAELNEEAFLEEALAS